MKRKGFSNIILVLIIIILAGVVVFLAINKKLTLPKEEISAPLPSEEKKTTPETQFLYINADLRFQISKPVAVTAEASVETDAYSRGTLGRVGAVRFMESGYTQYTQPLLVVHVYTDRAKMKKDFSGTATDGTVSLFGGAGLKTTSKTVNGKNLTIYYGTHAQDGEGGGAYPYLATEIIGPTYAYMLVSAYRSGDPNDTQFMQFITSFKAN